MTPLTRGRIAALFSPFLLATLMAGCSSSSGAASAASPTPGRHTPSTAELASLQHQLGALDGVTKVSTFTYHQGTFGNGPGTDGVFDSDATSQPELVKILEEAYRLTWFRSDLATGALIYVVQNPATGAAAGSDDLGFNTASIGPVELKARYGEPPATP